MIKTRYVVAFIILLIVVICSSFYSYHMNYSDELDENKDAIMDLTVSIQHQYDAIFYQICVDVERTVDALNNRGITESTLEEFSEQSIFITDYIILKDTGKLLGADSDEINITDARPFFIDEAQALCVGMIESNTTENKFYAVNKITKPSGESFLLMVGLNYEYINDVISPESFHVFGSYPYLISGDGYFLYHPDNRIYGKNIFTDKDYILDTIEMDELSYQLLLNSITKESNEFYYEAYGIRKVGYSRELQSFNGVVVLAGNFSEMKLSQYRSTFRTLMPLLISFSIAIYIFARYIFIMKYTDYFTEVKNNIAFRKQYAKNYNGKDQMVVFKLDSIISSSGEYSINDDKIFYKISDYFRKMKPMYGELYRISRVHYAFVFRGKKDDGIKILSKLKMNVLPTDDNSLLLRGKIIMIDLDSKGSLLDIDSHILNHMDEYYELLHVKKERVIHKYSELLHRFNEKLKRKSLVESMILNNEIEPYFQPIVDLITKKTYKYEVLMRPTNNLQMLTQELIDIAEANNWVESIDRSIIKQAFYLYNKVLVEKGKRLKLSVNLSGKSIHNDISEYITMMAKKCDVKTEDITIEITETAAFDNLEESIRNLRYLSSEGFKLAIDDFGTGYAHVELLSKLKVDYVKIDGIFVNNVEQDAQKIKTLNALVYLAKNYNTKVIAEYVETAAVVKILEKLSVEYGQGYYFDKPMNKATFVNKEL